MEYLMQWCEAFAILDGSANTVANVLLKQVILRHGCPKQLLSDQGKQFKGEVLRIIAAQLGI
jgi:transposase InsO family protein